MNVLIISYARFPEGDAESVRLHSIGKILRDIGYNVSYACMGYSNYLEKHEFDKFEYTSLRKKYTNKIERLYFYINYSSRLKKFILNKLKKEKIDVILFADISPFVIQMLKRICSKYNIKIVADSVEWYSPEQFKLKNLSPSMILKNIENKYVINKDIRVIAISSYLERHFKNKGCDVIRIPVILDVKKIAYEKKCKNNELTILYAGSPGKKDYVEEMLRGILLLNNNERKNLKFILAGVSDNDIALMFNKNEVSILKESVKCLGRVDRQIVLEFLSQADFTVLLRSSKQRYAKAGFPTKVVESLATSTPVILNYSSDLDKYITDRKEGLIVEECSSKSFSQVIKRALNLTEKDKIIMRANARKCAEENFDYRLYIEELEHMLGDIKNEKNIKHTNIY